MILKIHSERLRRAGWKLSLPIGEARRNGELVTLGDSQVLRWIDEMNGVGDWQDGIARARRELRAIHREENSIAARKRAKDVYAKMDKMQYRPDYMTLVIDKEKDYRRAVKGFEINGVKYTRLLGTVGGVKNSTIVFVNEELAPELLRRIENGRDMTKPIVPSKLEAYKSLVCSNAIPVSHPNGIIVVDDCNTTFTTDVLTLSDDNDGEPQAVRDPNGEITICCSDGFGLMSPALAARWSEELGLDYTVAGVNLRWSFTKGMAVCFDFVRFADEVAGTRIVKDVWGDERDIGEAELVLTASQLKLWDSYPNAEAYFRNCEENGYQLSVAKTSPKELDRVHAVNYQFLQSLRLTDDEIDELVEPEIAEIRDVLQLDWRKTVIFLKGSGMNERNVDRVDPDFAKALMIEPNILNDKFVRKKILGMIRKRIDDAKVGVIGVHGNYSIVCGDPYSLCQNIFALPVTGLLRSGELYSRFWGELGTETVACFRAPMSCHENIVKLNVRYDDTVRDWYRWCDTMTVINSWDSTMTRLNGMDFDGDLIFTTDNRVILKNIRQTSTVVCIQRKAEKIVPTEDDLIQANINSFGDDIGKTTNRITAMFEVQAGCDPDSPEYKELDYRIRCGQLLQQNCIDKAKGIISKPMPRTWYDRRSVNQIEDEEQREFYKRIIADRKPYFMKYIYPDLAAQYKNYIDNTNRKSLREFRKTVPELLSAETLTDAEREFVEHFRKHLPVGMNGCVMNRICSRLELEFDGFNSKPPIGRFDYRDMKSGEAYSQTQYREIGRIYSSYIDQMKEYAYFAKTQRVDEEDKAEQRAMLMQSFSEECDRVCSDRRTLCDIILDLCYKKEGTKQFAWDIVAEEMINNLLRHNGYKINYPVRDSEGDVYYGGERFTFRTKQIGGEEDTDPDE